MKPGLRFQTKLILSMIFMIAIVTVALLTATSAKVKNAYTREFSEEFDNLVDTLNHSRMEGAEEFTALSSELARMPAVIESITGKPSKSETAAFWNYYRESMMMRDRGGQGAIPPKPLSGGKEGLPRPFPGAGEMETRVGFVAVIDTDGNITQLARDDEGSRRRKLSQRIERIAEGNKERFNAILKSSSHHSLYIPVETPDGREHVIEMVSTPVVSPDTGEQIGRFLRSTSVESEAERSLERYQSEFESEERLKSGIYLDGQVFGRGLQIKQAKAIARVVETILSDTEEKPASMKIEHDMFNKPYLFYLEKLNEESSPQTVYQVAAFPMTNLIADLNDLRLRGSGIGALALLLGGTLAFFLARNLAGPINELSKGTKAIREGNLDCHLEVKSKDELGELTESFNQMVDQLKQKAVFRELLGKVSDESVAQAMISGTLDLELGGEIKDVSILFCDIRGFTELTENMHPGAVIELLNDHMTAMTKVVRSYYGVVDKFVGDEIMAVFGALKSHGNDAHYAAACAREMIAERERLNRDLKVPIEIGVGIASGEVVAGCMGSTDRLNYTVLGAKVNLAARLCTVAESGEIVTDGATIDQISPAPTTEAISDLTLKGFSNQIEAFRLIDLAEPDPRNEPVIQKEKATKAY
ncbi:MAG: adenylate/guanylate cyclase domain-containing protein [Verrucomicrobiales bacterium]|nr:adenylate/guanylate cyclase domain-containing protein [Verrucomicrobiales bacterium]